MEISVFHGRRPILLKMCTAVKSWIRLVPIHGLLRRCAYQWVYVTSPETNYDWRTPYAQTSLWPRHAYGPWSHCLSATKPPVECSYRFCNLHSALGKARIHAAILCRHPSLSDVWRTVSRPSVSVVLWIVTLFWSTELPLLSLAITPTLSIYCPSWIDVSIVA